MASLDEYFKQANDWGYDLHEANRKWNKRYFILLCLAFLISFTAVLGVVSLAHINKTEPYVVEVNSATAQVNVISPTNFKNYKAAKPLVSMFIAKYLNECIGFNHKYYKEWAINCQLFSGKEVSAEYVDLLFNSPKSPVILFKKGDTRTVFIHSIIPKGKDKKAVLIDYSTTDKIKGKIDKVVQWTGVIEYGFGKKIIDEDEHKFYYINPLGFYIKSFVKNQKFIKAR